MDPSHQSPDDLDEFVDNDYPVRMRNYKELARLVERHCQQELKKRQIPHVTSYRVKEKESLRAKLRKLQKKRGKAWTKADILENVFDFAGVRISLYWIDDRNKIETMLKEDCKFIFNKLDTRRFEQLEGTSSDKTGDHWTEWHLQRPRYKADHYIIRINDDELRGEDLSSEPIEIQVMSTLKSSWAQIQHDLGYKRLYGSLSPAEINALDNLGRLTDLGETYLHQLSEFRTKRDIPFKNVYELGSFLSDWMEDAHQAKLEDLGSLNGLHRLLTKLSLDKPKKLQTILPDLKGPVLRGEASSGDFPDMRLQPSVYIIDQVLQKYEQKLTQETAPYVYRQEMRYRNMLETILRTILWLEEFFPPHQWEAALTSRGTIAHNVTRIDCLAWLGSGRIAQLLQDDNNHNYGEDDCEKVGKLWTWFSKHHHRAVHMAFLVSQFVPLHDVKSELAHFIRTFSHLGKTSRNNFENKKGWNGHP